MNHRHHAAVVIGGIVLFAAGLFLGRMSLTSRIDKPSLSQVQPQKEPQSPKVSEDEQKALLLFAALQRPVARQLFKAALDSSAGELEVFVTRSRTSIRSGGKSLFSSTNGPTFAEAMEDFELLRDLGLIRILRQSTTGGTVSSETTTYAVTADGYAVAKAMKIK